MGIKRSKTLMRITFQNCPAGFEDAELFRSLATQISNVSLPGDVDGKIQISGLGAVNPDAYRVLVYPEPNVNSVFAAGPYASPSLDMIEETQIRCFEELKGNIEPSFVAFAEDIRAGRLQVTGSIAG